MGVDRIGGNPAHRPVLTRIEGTRKARDAETPTDRVDLDSHVADEPHAVRTAKVAEARIKILNDYYSRRDVQRQLAERLVLELGPPGSAPVDEDGPPPDTIA